MQNLGLKDARKGGCYLKKFVSRMNAKSLGDVVIVDPSCIKNGKMFYAIITNLEISGYFRIFGAKKTSKNTWEVILYDGSTLQIEEAPENIRELPGAYLVQHENFFGYVAEVPGSFENAEKSLENERWHLYWDAEDGRTLKTSALVKLWKDKKGKRHAITETGSHYVF